MKNDRLNMGQIPSCPPTHSLILVLILFLSMPCLSQQRWEKNYGGAGIDRSYSVQQTPDGGYIVVGIYDYCGVNPQVYLIKANASGDTLWTRTYGRTGIDYGTSVQRTSDGGYVIAGVTNSHPDTIQVYLIKTNANGDTLWTKTYGGAGDDYGQSILQTLDGGYIVAGFTNSFGKGGQVYLIKTNASGDSLWTKTYGGRNSGGYSIQPTSDGGYIITGNSNGQVYLIKTNTNGDTLWTRTYGWEYDDVGYSVHQTSDGGYIIAGVAFSFSTGSYDVCLIKTNTTGDTLWTRTYGGTGIDYGHSVQQTTDGGYIVTGFTSSFGNKDQVYLIKTNAAGDTLWTRTYGGSGDEHGYSIQQTSDGGYVIAGLTTSFGNNDQVYLIKTDGQGNSGVETAEERDQRLEVRITAKPNPFTYYATVPGHEAERFSLYDIAGRKVGTYRGDRIGANLPAGVYFLRTSGKTSMPVRIVKVR